MASARARRSGKVLVMIDSVVGKIRAAAAPIAKRAAISSPDRGAQGGQQAGHGEAGQAGSQGLPPAVAVADVAAGEDQGGEGQVVAVDHPLQGAGAGPEAQVERGERDVDDGGVEVDGIGGGEDHSQYDQRLPPIRCGHSQHCATIVGGVNIVW